MNKKLIIILSMLTVGSLVGCNKTEEVVDNTQKVVEEVKKDDKQMMLNSLSIYMKDCTYEEVEEGFLVIKTDLIDGNNAVIDFGIDSTVKSVLEEFNKVQYQFSDKGKVIATIDFVKEDVEKFVEDSNLKQYSSNKFIEQGYED